MAYEFRIIDFSNYDGDSFDLTLDLGFELVLHRKCRIHGVDTPELRGGTELSKAAGRLARDEARVFVRRALDSGHAVFLSEEYAGKFGRPLGDIIAPGGRSLRAFLIGARLGVPYHGQAKAEVASLHEANLRALKEAGRIE